MHAWNPHDVSFDWQRELPSRSHPRPSLAAVLSDIPSSPLPTALLTARTDAWNRSSWALVSLATATTVRCEGTRTNNSNAKVACYEAVSLERRRRSSRLREHFQLHWAPEQVKHTREALNC